MTKRIMRFSTGIDVKTTRYIVELNKSVSDIDGSTEYYVLVYSGKTHGISEKTFSDFSAAKRRFLFEVENAVIFTDLD